MTVYEEIQAAIDLAWATDDPDIQQHQVELVGNSQIPKPEELIFSIIAKIFTETT